MRIIYPDREPEDRGQTDLPFDEAERILGGEVELLPLPNRQTMLLCRQGGHYNPNATNVWQQIEDARARQAGTFPHPVPQVHGTAILLWTTDRLLMRTQPRSITDWRWGAPKEN